MKMMTYELIRLLAEVETLEQIHKKLDETFVKSWHPHGDDCWLTDPSSSFGDSCGYRVLVSNLYIEYRPNVPLGAIMPKLIKIRKFRDE